MRNRLDEASARRGMALDAIEAEVRGWIGRWWGEAVAELEEPPPVRELVVDNAVHYGVWHAVGPTRGQQPGYLALNRLAIREAGNVDRGTEAASETWLDVRTRLEKTVARAAAGKSVPDFSGPKEIGEDNCHRYHGIQARLRAKGKWTKRRATEVYEEGRHSSEWRAGFRAAEARTYAMPLHFAAWWTLLDLKTRTTRDGRVKGPGWWWSMLLHALDLEKIDALGGDRNDPTEALLRLRLRFAVAQGLAGWLRRWARSHRYWSQVEFGLPDPENAVARKAAVEALDLVRPALDAAIDGIDVSEAERKVLRGTLLRGENVRTSIGRVEGSDPGDRQARLFALGERIGRSAGDHLGGDSDGVSGGGGGGHVHADAIMAKLASGMPPSPDEARVLSAAVAACEACRDRWAGTVDMTPYFEGATALAPRPRRVWVGVGVLALAMLALAVIPMSMDRRAIGLRGAEGAIPATLDLVVRRGGEGASERFDPTRTYARGDTVFFVVSTDQPTDLRIRVSGPEGDADLGARASGPERETFGGEQAVFYRFERDGTYRFTASTDPGQGSADTCEPPACVLHEVEVAP